MADILTQYGIDLPEEWVVQRQWTSRAEVIVHFYNGRPSISELKAIRQLIPRLNNMPISKVKGTLTDAGRYSSEIISGIDARDLYDKAIHLELHAELIDHSGQSFMPIHTKTNTCLLIEGEDDHRKCVQALIEAGVEVTDIEAD